jgi:hypothetical protein
MFDVELRGHWLANTIDDNRSSVSRRQLIRKSASILFPREHIAKAKPPDFRAMGPLMDVARNVRHVRFGLDCVAKIESCRVRVFFAKTRNGKQSPIRIDAIALSKSPVSLTLGDEAPHIFTRKSRPRPLEFLILGAKRLLRHNRLISGPKSDMAAGRSVPRRDLIYRMPAAGSASAKQHREPEQIPDDQLSAGGRSGPDPIPKSRLSTESRSQAAHNRCRRPPIGCRMRTELAAGRTQGQA